MSEKPKLRVILCSPRGFCAGVTRAIDVVETALKLHGAPVYVRHEIVHNKYVVDSLKAKGAVFIKELDEAPAGDAPVIFSAHGVPKSVPAEAERRKLNAIDATCPLVTKVHREAQVHFKRGRHIIMIGHAGHPEVVGTLGQLPAGAITLVGEARDVADLVVPEGKELAFVTQTTLSVDDTREAIAALKAKFPRILEQAVEDICYATTNRQEAVKIAAPQVDAVIVVGAANSSNSQRLREVAEREGCPIALLAPNADGLDFSKLEGIGSVAITAGASAPEILVEQILDGLAERYRLEVETLTTREENMFFPLPRALREPAPAQGLMAVYTEVGDEALARFLEDYDLGRPQSLKGIAEGVENSNYLLHTERGAFLLTLYEKRVEEADLPFFLGLMEHLARRGVNCPQPVRARSGAAIGRLAGRAAAIVTFLEGLSARRPTVAHCGEVGEALARMHAASAGFALTRANALSLAGWPALFAAARARADEVAPDLAAETQAQLDALARLWPTALPAGVIHADLFPDNVFFLADKLSGLIDFYFACNDFLAYDLAVCLNSWAFEPDGAFNFAKGRAMLAAYERVRPLEAAEVAALPTLARGAALRFMLTRLVDWLNVPPGALVKPKDPREYLAKLRFHTAVGSAREYGWRA